MRSPRLQRLRTFLTACVILALLLPTTTLFVPSVALAQTGEPVTEAIPSPALPPSWSEVATQPQYIPSFEPASSPSVLSPSAAVVAAVAETVAADTEVNKTGVVVGAAHTTLSPTSGHAQLGALQLSLSSAAGALAQTLDVQAEVLPVAQAQTLSPVGMAFQLKFAPVISAGVTASSQIVPHQPLSLTLDYSQIPLRYGGSFADRLTLYRVTQCAGAASGQISAEQSQTCQWQALPTVNDRAQQRLTVALFADASLTSADQMASDTPQPEYGQPDYSNSNDKSALSAPNSTTFFDKLYLPLINQNSSRIPGASPDENPIYVLAAAASGQQGTYQATPLSNSNDYQVSLATGAMQTSYPVPIPPAAGPLAPTVALQYNSGSVDGMNANKNNQPSWVGIGWGLEPGYITRRLKTCGLSQAPGDFCQTGDNYVLVLNGVASPLVKDTSGLYHPQNDPLWKIEKLTSGNTSHPDEQKEYWQVTMPNGTKYRFGGEFDTD